MKLTHVRSQYGRKVHLAYYTIGWRSLCGLGWKCVTVTNGATTCVSCLEKNERLHSPDA